MEPSKLQGCAEASLLSLKEVAARGCHDPITQEPHPQPLPPNPFFSESRCRQTSKPRFCLKSFRPALPCQGPGGVGRGGAGRGGGISGEAWREEAHPRPWGLWRAEEFPHVASETLACSYSWTCLAVQSLKEGGRTLPGFSFIPSPSFSFIYTSFPCSS